jgi:hypothetical protein
MLVHKVSSKTLKNGTVKEYAWTVPVYDAKAIRAKSEKEATQEFERLEKERFDDNMESLDSSRLVQIHNISFQNINATVMDGATNVGIEDTLMKSVKYPKYDFISADDKYLKNTGYCVRDCFVGKYSEKIKKLNNNLFDILCYESLGLPPPLDNFFEEDVINMYANPNWKQEVLNDDTLTQEDKDELINNYKAPKWNPSQGVSPKMLNYICKKLNISCYAFDITKNCFLKHITKNRNYDALVYYCVNEHFYFISDKKEVLKLTASARDIETKIKSSIIEDDIKKENIYTDATIYENISIDKLMEYRLFAFDYPYPLLEELTIPMDHSLHQLAFYLLSNIFNN